MAVRPGAKLPTNGCRPARLLPSFLPLHFGLPPSLQASLFLSLLADCNPGLLLRAPSKLNITHGAFWAVLGLRGTGL